MSSISGGLEGAFGTLVVGDIQEEEDFAAEEIPRMR
jgi:hypothetical protein